MTKEEFFTDYERLIVGSHVEGFRLVGQFPVLDLRNEKENKKIEFHIDCRISSNDKQLDKLVNQFSKYDEDIYETSYLIGINRKSILDVEFSQDGNLNVLFSNKLKLTFRLNDEWPEPLNISVFHEGKYVRGCRLLNNGSIEK